jgi:hypothetical protein
MFGKLYRVVRVSRRLALSDPNSAYRTIAMRAIVRGKCGYASAAEYDRLSYINLPKERPLQVVILGLLMLDVLVLWDSS